MGKVRFAVPYITAASVVIMTVEFAFDRYFMSLMLNSRVNEGTKGAARAKCVAFTTGAVTTSLYWYPGLISFGAGAARVTS